MKTECENIIQILSQVESEISALKRFLELDEKSSIIAYRGESKDYGETKLLPSIHRANMSIEDENSFFYALRDYNITNLSNKSYIEKAIEAQHYLQTSRLLDISFNVLIATYFATIGNYKDDAKIYIFCFPKSFSPSSNYLEDYYKDMLNPKGKTKLILRNNFKVITHGYYNERMKLQSGGFIFFPSENIANIPSCFYHTITIAARCKESIKKELEIYFSIYESSVFPEKEKRKEIVMEAVKRNRQEHNKDDILLEISSYFEYLKYDIKADIKTLKGIINRESAEFDRRKKEIHRRLRKSRKDLIKNISDLEISDDRKENLIKIIDFNFEGLTISVKRS